jgi:spermidine synthase
MTNHNNKHPFSFALLLLFVGSGCAALIYEVVWFHLLRFVIGASAVSLGILLASFMGGMFLGSLLFHRFVSIQRHPLKMYAYLELGIGAFGILIPFMLPLVTQLYTSFTGYGYFNIIVRGLICAICLLPPTILMGATLPAISRWVEMTRSGVAQLGFFYGANIVGAVIGTLLAGFYFLRVHDVVITSAFAVALNITIALIALTLANKKTYKAVQTSDQQETLKLQITPAYIAIALSGLTALGAQIVWTRLISLLLGATVYTFSVILAVFLSGLGIGSAIGSTLAAKVKNPTLALAICQLLLVAAIPYAAYAINHIMPELHFTAVNQHWLLDSLDDLLRCAVAILPATILWGASFPLALATVGLGEKDPGKLVGRVYAANTVGAIAGAILFSLMMVPVFGTFTAQQGLTVISAIAVVILITPSIRSAISIHPRTKLFKQPLLAAGCFALVIILSGIATTQTSDIHPGMIGYGRDVYRWNEPDEFLHTSEGINASVAVSEQGGYKNFHVSGKVVASSWPADMRLQRMLTHIPSLIHPEPKSVLIIGFGAGVTAGTFALYPSIERIVIVEIEPEVPATSGDYFKAENYDILNDPRTEVIYDDARHFITTTKEKFDIITADPIHPWVKGAAALYTKEFFELCKQHLNAGGLITQWVPFYETSEAAVKSEVATFFEAFPYGSIWNSDEYSTGYDVSMLGQLEPIKIDAATIQQRIDNNPKVKASLAAVNFYSAIDILKSFAGQRGDIGQWLSDAELNLDKNLRLEYLAGQALDTQIEDYIYTEMTKDLPYPDDLFIVTEDQKAELKEWFDYYSTDR